ncbi:hypothetical protein Efla_006155 [Eimeria flavescens]
MCPGARRLPPGGASPGGRLKKPALRQASLSIRRITSLLLSAASPNYAAAAAAAATTVAAAAEAAAAAATEAAATGEAA